MKISLATYSIILICVITTSIQSGQKRTAEAQEPRPSKRLLIATTSTPNSSDNNNTNGTHPQTQVPKK